MKASFIKTQPSFIVCIRLSKSLLLIEKKFSINRKEIFYWLLCRSLLDYSGHLLKLPEQHDCPYNDYHRHYRSYIIVKTGCKQLKSIVQTEHIQHGNSPTGHPNPTHNIR